MDIHSKADVELLRPKLLDDDVNISIDKPTKNYSVSWDTIRYMCGVEPLFSSDLPADLLTTETETNGINFNVQLFRTIPPFWFFRSFALLVLLY